MKVLIQRVKKASCLVEEKTVGEIQKGLLVFLGVHKNDTQDKIDWLVNKIVDLRIFQDTAGKMNLSLKEVQGEILLISQFTLYGSCLNGRRPDFIEAAPPELGLKLYEGFKKKLEAMLERKIETGIFGAYMEISLINDGPVTFLIEK